MHNYCATLSTKDRSNMEMRENGRRGDGVGRDDKEGMTRIDGKVKEVE
jgi:hypothetical protein